MPERSLLGVRDHVLKGYHGVASDAETICDEWQQIGPSELTFPWGSSQASGAMASGGALIIKAVKL